MFLKVPKKYKEMVISIQKVRIGPFEDNYCYELSLADGYGIYGSEDDSGLVYFDSYNELRKEMKYIRRIK